MLLWFAFPSAGSWHHTHVRGKCVSGGGDLFGDFYERLFEELADFLRLVEDALHFFCWTVGGTLVACGH